MGITATGVLGVLSKERLSQLAREMDLVIAADAQKAAQVAGIATAQPGVDVLLARFTRDELRAVCRAHSVDHRGRSRNALMARLGVAPKAASLDQDRQIHHAFGLPYPGDVAVVRQRQYMVKRVHAAPERNEQTLVELVCLDDDAAGRELAVLWERELGARVIKPEDKGLGTDITRLDPPRHFAAYLHALKWRSVTSTDGKLFQSPFRAGIKIMRHQLVPLMKALELPRANMFIADDVGLGKTIEAGLVMQELLLRQRIDHVLIVSPASVCLQWQGEMEKRFGLRFEIYNLAKLYPEAKVLFTAFNRNLATNISGLLDTLCGPERERIEVANIQSWAVGYASRQWGNVKIANDTQFRECWDAALGGGKAARGWSVDDYESEWTDVVQFHGVTTFDEYAKVSRAGSKHTLKRTERAAIWIGLAAFRAEFDRRTLVDWPDIVRKVRKHLEETEAHPFRAVVVDEAQDIDAEQWRLLRSLTPDDDNNLFITGDAHQRIYGKPVTLSQFGINIRGRSHRLKINYRTTEQVLRWATKLVAWAQVDDLDGAADNTSGYRSLYTGPDPDVRTFASEREEAKFLVDRVRELVAISPPEEIAIVARFKKRVRAYAEALEACGITATTLDGDNTGPGVRLATMHRVKGLDFSHVIMQIPKDAGAAKDPRDQNLLYVAATRCRKTLTVLVDESARTSR